MNGLDGDRRAALISGSRPPTTLSPQNGDPGGRDVILHDVTVTSDREGIDDAIYRFVEGIDKRDAELLASASTEDIVFDLGGLDPSAGSFKPYVGREFTVDQLMSHIGKLDTMHAVANVRAEIGGDQAHLTCYLIGQHHRPGRSASADYRDHLWLGNFFNSHLIRDHDHV
jgi:hypothetical protein